MSIRSRILKPYSQEKKRWHTHDVDFKINKKAVNLLTDIPVTLLLCGDSIP